MRRGGISFGDRKVKCLYELALWLPKLTLRGKNIDLNHFKADVLYDAIVESRLDFEDTRNGKGGIGNPKEFYMKN